MIYICADDYGLCNEVSGHIEECFKDGPLNKISIFPNFDCVDFDKISCGKKVYLSLHINLVEGKSLVDESVIGLLVNKDGYFKYSFPGLLLVSVFNKKKFEKQVLSEIEEQLTRWRKILPDGSEIMIDSHQHTHMIPGVFRMLMKALDEQGIRVKYLRIPNEPTLPYIMTPSLWFTYSLANIIKQWLLKFLWLFNRREYKKREITSAYFCGVMFSGNMDEKRVRKILPHYIKKAEKNGKDIEVLFHPGYISKECQELKDKKITFDKFYYSEGRKIEFDTLKSLHIERGAE